LFKKNFNVVRNAIDTTKFEFDKLKADSVKRILNINSGELSFIHVGRFDPQKNHKFLIEIFEGLVKYNKSFKRFRVSWINKTGSGRFRKASSNFFRRFRKT
jgi:glycosyltransferase involved in cell wall biosynthesis